MIVKTLIIVTIVGFASADKMIGKCDMTAAEGSRFHVTSYVIK